MARNPLTDTDETQAVTPGVGDSSERIRAIARDEAKTQANAAIAKCPHKGEIWDAINDLRQKHGAIMNEQASQKGVTQGFLDAQKAQQDAHAKQMAKLVGAITIGGILVQAAVALLKVRHGG